MSVYCSVALGDIDSGGMTIVVRPGEPVPHTVLFHMPSEGFLYVSKEHDVYQFEVKEELNQMRYLDSVIIGDGYFLEEFGEPLKFHPASAPIPHGYTLVTEDGAKILRSPITTLVKSLHSKIYDIEKRITRLELR